MEPALILLEEIRDLMELNGDNPFKIRAFDKALKSLEGRTDLLTRAQAGTLTELDGIGKGISEVLTEFLLKGHSSVRDELKKSIPPALLELTRVPGLGPKKAKVIIEELKIETLAELEYACRENRLTLLKGFGEKAQTKILEGIQFIRSHEHEMRLGDIESPGEELLAQLSSALQKKLGPTIRIDKTGPWRRQLETLASLDILVASESIPQSLTEKIIADWRKSTGIQLPVNIHTSKANQFGFELARLTASDAHWKALGSPKPFLCTDEKDFYKKLDTPHIPPECRETGEEVKWARSGKIKTLFPRDGVRGVFHNHTVRSDGSATLEEMVTRAEKLGLEYIGISEHSQSAFYARGLKPADLLEQKKEIEHVQAQHPKIKIFWGIESDILKDGSLDYNDKILSQFDFVVASIHSRFGMNREQMTERLLRAIRNPHTKFIGHLTGRLLLGRAGFDVDMEKLIEEAARCKVSIEINAHPERLDIDWRWGGLLRKYKTPVCINPDAHNLEGLEHTHFGVTVARKALLPQDQVLNSLGPKEIEKWLKQ